MGIILAAVADKPLPLRVRVGDFASHRLRCGFMTTPALTVYTTSWCGYCHRLMTVLNAEGIAYTAVDIEHDPAAAQFVGSVNGGNRTVPTVKFADGSTLTNPNAAQVKAKLAETGS